MKTDTARETGPQNGFDEQAMAVLDRFRSALAHVIDALPVPGRRSRELTRTLRIDKKLGWKIANIVQSTDPFEAAQHVPGTAGLRIFLNAAKKQSVPAELIEAVNAAQREFEQLIEVHAGDRASLEMMLAGCARRGRERVDLEHRRAAFRANSYIWGIQARAQLRAYVLHPSTEADRFDILSLRGYVGLRWIRANVPWVIHRSKWRDDDGLHRYGPTRQPLEPPQNDGGAPLLERFCSRPLPKIRRIAAECESEFVEHEIVEGEVGDTAAMTCILADVARDAAPRYQDEHNRCVELVARANLPCENLVFDQIVHEDLFGEVHPELAVYSELTGETPPLRLSDRRFKLPHCETVEHLGRGLAVLNSPDVPRYSEMTRHVFERTGWDPARFNVYRVRMACPPIPTAVVVRTDLPPAS